MRLAQSALTVAVMGASPEIGGPSGSPPFLRVCEIEWSLPVAWLHLGDFLGRPGRREGALARQALVIPPISYIIGAYPKPMEAIRYGKTDETG